MPDMQKTLPHWQCLPNLQSLRLCQIKKSVDIAFISEIQSLTQLEIVLGGRTSIAHISPPQLKTLQITRIRDLNDVGDLARFPLLEKCIIEDQIQLSQIKFAPNPHLKDVFVLNCKTLTRLDGLAELTALHQLRISGTTLNIEQLIAQGLPPTLKIFGFYTQSNKQNHAIRQRLDDLGYDEWSQ